MPPSPGISAQPPPPRTRSGRRGYGRCFGVSFPGCYSSLPQDSATHPFQPVHLLQLCSEERRGVLLTLQLALKSLPLLFF